MGQWLSFTAKNANVGDVVVGTVMATLSPSSLDSNGSGPTYATYAWSTVKVWMSTDGGQSVPFTQYTGDLAIAYDEAGAGVGTGTNTTRFDAIFTDPGYYILEVQCTASIHDSASGAVVGTVVGTGYIGGTAEDVGDGTETPHAAGLFAAAEDGGGRSTQAGKKGIDVRGPAYIFVGDTGINWFEDIFVQLGLRRDEAKLRTFFVERGYKVTIVKKATAAVIINDLHSASAAAFLGHNGAYEGQFDFATADDDYITPIDIAQAICNNVSINLSVAAATGRHLDYAIFHVCHANIPDLRAATVGSGPGYFYAPTSFWNPVLNCEQSLGYKKLQYPVPY